MNTTAARQRDKRDYDRQRGSARKRGYTTQWDKAAKAFKRQFPLCSACQKIGIVTAAYAVDHIVPHRGDMVLFWDKTNWQSLCKPHHNSAKQSEESLGYSSAIGEDGWPLDAAHPANTGKIPQAIGTAKSHPAWFRKVFIPLTIVCGAPGSGKSTYVNNNAHARDLIICFDQIATRLFGRSSDLRAHATLSGQQVGDILRARNEMIADLMWEAAKDKWPAAWLIISEPKAIRRQWWQDKLEPKAIVVMRTPAEVCKRRVLTDAQNGDARARNIAKVIDKWWNQYSHRRADVDVFADA